MSKEIKPVSVYVPVPSVSDKAVCEWNEDVEQWEYKKYLWEFKNQYVLTREELETMLSKAYSAGFNVYEDTISTKEGFEDLLKQILPE